MLVVRRYVNLAVLNSYHQVAGYRLSVVIGGVFTVGFTDCFGVKSVRAQILMTVLRSLNGVAKLLRPGR